MRLPAVQQRLREIADALENGFNSQTLTSYAEELRALSVAIIRKRNQVYAPPTSRIVTPALQIQITNQTKLRIANTLRINPGRVSEALHGKRQ